MVSCLCEEVGLQTAVQILEGCGLHHYVKMLRPACATQSCICQMLSLHSPLIYFDQAPR